jgi:hypothetical protein
MVVSEPRIIYAPRPDTDPEAEVSALSAVYKFILDCTRTGDRTPSGPEDDVKESNGYVASQHHNR